MAELYDVRDLDIRTSDPEEFDLDIVIARIGGLTLSRLTYQAATRVVARGLTHFSLHAPLHGCGQVRHRSGAESDRQVAVVDRMNGFTLSPASAVDVSWSVGAEQLILQIPKARLEAELEHVLGRPITRPLRFDCHTDFHTPLGRTFRAALDMVLDDVGHEAGLADHRRAASHLERLLLAGLLLSQPHNYTAALDGHDPSGPQGPIGRALSIIRERPGAPWTTSSLAEEVHLSVRALHEGFRRDVGLPPMTYLRELRLRRAYEALQNADPGDATVATVATRFGFTHLGRFAQAYRQSFGEAPSATLRSARDR